MYRGYKYWSTLNWQPSFNQLHIACDVVLLMLTMEAMSRGQTDTDNAAKYRFIRNRIVPLGLKRIVI